jgi:hypothetical protein
MPRPASVHRVRTLADEQPLGLHAPARTLDEVAATRVMIDRTEATFDLKPKRLIADAAYGTGASSAGWWIGRPSNQHSEISRVPAA